MKHHPTGETGTLVNSLWIFNRSFAQEGQHLRAGTCIDFLQQCLINICGLATDVKLQAISFCTVINTELNNSYVMLFSFNSVSISMCWRYPNKLRGRVKRQHCPTHMSVQFQHVSGCYWRHPGSTGLEPGLRLSVEQHSKTVRTATAATE